MALAHMAVVPEARTTDGLPAGEVAKPVWRRWLKRARVGARKKADGVAFDEATQAVRARRIVYPQHHHMHRANDGAYGLLQRLFFSLKGAPVAAEAPGSGSDVRSHTPAGNGEPIAAAQEGIAQQKAKD